VLAFGGVESPSCHHFRRPRRSPQAEVARAYRISEGWISRLLARYRIEGDAAFEPRSTRPKTSPDATSEQTVELILSLRAKLAGKGLDAGPETIAWHLDHHHHISISRATR
jgi:Helix-turn-helix domain